MGRVLVACEYSGKVRDAYIAAGHCATSCDIDHDTDRPGPHYRGDVFDIIGDDWDLMIAHPPCTYLCSSGLHWNKRDPERKQKTEAALEFVRKLIEADIPRIVIENPVGCIGTRIRKADQTIQPYQYGHDASKQTCLWIKNLPLLRPTGFVEPRVVFDDNGKPAMRWANQTDSGQNRLPPSADRWKIRSETYQGWAAAMADQWGPFIAHDVAV